MAKPRKVSVVDGYSALKAAQHAHKSPRRPTASPPVPATAAEGREPADLQKLGAHVAHTVVPVRRVIECYECGYKFQLHGKAATTNCSKCRAVLDLTDHAIDGPWTRPLKTAGTIHLTARGVLQSGALVARDFILEGAVENGTVRALHRLELRSGARFPETSVQAPDLVVAPGAAIALANPAEYRDVEIAGAFEANLTATGIVTIRATGSFRGQLQAVRLIVEEGAGLRAVACIRGPPAAS